MPELKIKSIQVVIQNILSAFEQHSNAIKELRRKHSDEVSVVNNKNRRQWQMDDCEKEQYNLRLKHNKEDAHEKDLFNKNLQKLSPNLEKLINLDEQLTELLPKLSFIEISVLLYVLDADQQAIALTHLNEQEDSTAIITANEYKQVITLKSYNPGAHPKNNECWQAFCLNKIAPYEQQEAEKQKQEQQDRILQEKLKQKKAEETQKIKFAQRVQAETTLKNHLEQIMQQVKEKEWQSSGIPSFFRSQSHGQYRSLQPWRPNTVRTIEKLLDEESKQVMAGRTSNYSKVKEKMIQALENVTKQPHSFWSSFVIGRSNDTIQAYETILQSLKK